MATLAVEGDGGLVFVKRVTQTSNATTLTLDGINGNEHGCYLLVGNVMVPASTATTYALRPNGLTTNLVGLFATNEAAPAATTDWVFTASINEAAVSQVFFQAWIMAQPLVNGVASRRKVIVEAIGDLGAAPDLERYHLRGRWTETSTNLTSIVLASSAATSVRVGSELNLYRLRSGFHIA